MIPSRLLFLLLILTSMTASGQSDKPGYGHFKMLKKGEGSSFDPTGSINGDEVSLLAFVTHFNPESIAELDLVKVIVTREENGEEGVYQFTGEQFKALKNMSDRYEGYKVIYPRLVDFKKNPSDGKGEFYHRVYNTHFNANYFFSRKGIDYSTRDEVDQYDLFAHAVGYKIEKYVDEYVDGQLKKVPVYGDPIYLINKQKLTIKTSPDLPPMPKSDAVRDVSELDDISLGPKPGQDRIKGDATFIKRVKEVCDCYSNATSKLSKTKCKLLNTSNANKYQGSQKDTFKEEVAACMED